MVLVVTALAFITSACAVRTSVYQTWGQRLAAPLNLTVEDYFSCPVHHLVSANMWITKYHGQDIIRVHQEQPILTFVMPNGPAFRAGLRSGDVIKAVAGQQVATPEQLATALRIAHVKAGLSR